MKVILFPKSSQRLCLKSYLTNWRKSTSRRPRSERKRQRKKMKIRTKRLKWNRDTLTSRNSLVTALNYAWAAKMLQKSHTFSQLHSIRTYSNRGIPPKVLCPSCQHSKTPTIIMITKKWQRPIQTCLISAINNRPIFNNFLDVLNTKKLYTTPEATKQTFSTRITESMTWLPSWSLTMSKKNAKSENRKN